MTCILSATDPSGVVHRIPGDSLDQVAARPEQAGSEQLIRTGPVSCFSTTNFQSDPPTSALCRFE